jgi:hypothetical protein
MIGHDKLWSYIIKNQEELEKIGINIQVNEIYNGDKYRNESGSQINLKVFDKIYNIGYCSVTEDDDDWAQAESYIMDWCKCNDEQMECNELYNLLFNYKSHLRDKKLNQLI